MKLKWNKKEKEILGSSLSVDSADTPRVENKLDELIVAESKTLPWYKNNFIFRNYKIVSIASMVLVVGVTGFLFWSNSNKPIRIGSHEVSKQDIGSASDAIKNAYEANGQRPEDADIMGRNQAVLLAALKSEADKRGIKYDREVIDESMFDSFAFYGGKDQYFEFMKTENNWSEDDVYNHRTTEYLKDKLRDELLARRTYALMFIRWDNLRAYNPDNFDKLYKQKEDLLRSKYLPLFEQKADVKTLASKAEYSDKHSEEEQMKIFAESDGVPVTFSVTEMGSGELQKYPEGEDMLSTIESLQNVGDFTGPFKSNMGMLVIARLEKSEGGLYRNWDHFREQYQKQSGVSFEPSMLDKVFSSVKSSFGNALAGLFKPQKAEATSNCLDTHKVIYAITYVDADTGAPLPASAVSGIAFGFGANRATSHCNPNNYRSNGWSVGPAFNTAGRTWHNVSKAFRVNPSNASVQIIVDCNGPEWSILGSAQRNIPGYTYVRRNMIPGQTSPFQWNPGLNGDNVKWTIMYYRKNRPTHDPGVTNLSCVVRPDAKGWVREGNGSMTINAGIKISVSGGTGGDIPAGWTISIPNLGINQGLFYGHLPRSGEHTVPFKFNVNVSNPGNYSGMVHGVANGQNFNCPFTIRVDGVLPEVNCSAVNFDPKFLEPGGEIEVSAGFTTSGGMGPKVPYSINVTIGDFVTNEEIAAGEVQRRNGSVSERKTFEVPDTLASEQYNIKVTVSINGTVVKTCPEQTLDVAKAPYFKIYGGDASIGAAFDSGGVTSCSGTSPTIAGWTRQDDHGNYVGSGVQLAAYTISEIIDFSSGQTRSPSVPNNLSFSNEIGTYGGLWSGNNLPCAADYWSGYENATPLGNSNFDTSTGGEYRYDGNVDIASGGDLNIGNGNHVSLYVKGNVTISNNIILSESGFSNPSDVPSFRLVVAGNIFVQPNVSRIDGLYVATTKEGGEGKFYTCAADYGAPDDEDELAACENPFTLYGSVVADLVKLSRTGGSVSKSVAGETPDTGEPAEKFIAIPEVWLTSDFRLGNDTDSMRTLPPSL